MSRSWFPDVVVHRHEGVACFDSLDQWLFTDIRGWTLADHVDDEQFSRFRAGALRRCRRPGPVRGAGPDRDGHPPGLTARACA
ncbi:hypothetical protein [Mycobacterium sp.]|uniref:hypothetical protein n=1 Tax=Mycobacterium sp. TaxID=1785 RepID=UPI003C75E22B